MKYLYTLLFVALLNFNLSAQDFTYSPSQYVFTELQTSQYGECHIDIVNDTAGVSYAWELVSNTLPSGWWYSLCDYNGCYPGIPNSGTMQSITTNDAQNGVYGFFKLTINPEAIAGSGVVEIYVYDQTDYNIGDTVTMEFNHVSSVGINQNEIVSLSTYPNPTSDNLNIKNNGNTSVQYDILNVVGARIANGVVTVNETEVVDMSKLPSGIYFVSFTTSEGIRRTEKVIKR
ncbi:MAG: T9SS type A sorting domain-containing protein [Crocinitomicaceae bacterium]|nr:T9SS type A sorting domain-containing protein [Crocinitomicaceae bacterium]